jgi:hypothetical protein
MEPEGGSSVGSSKEETVQGSPWAKVSVLVCYICWCPQSPQQIPSCEACVGWGCLFFFFLQFWDFNSGPTSWVTPPVLFLWWVFLR